ncbi:MAG: UDP-glucose 4-epimerase GalE [Candidatus Bruticola sp.]
MSETVLVTGGAGYIGSTVCDEILKTGRRVVVVDNFCHGHRAAVPKKCCVEECSIEETDRLSKIMRSYEVYAVMHFAAFIEVGESMRHPGAFFANNTMGALSVLRAMTAAGVKRLVFSSTAAVYGLPKQVPITEDQELQPTNAYGESKLMVERMLRWFEEIHSIKSARLRYFNAAGNTPERGEDHHPESHLIPLVLQAAMGQRPHISIFGTDYATPDGTCVRDYVHILDLAQAHILALEALESRGGLVYNVGSGQGFSVRQVIEAVRQVTKCSFEVKEEGRRPGDPDFLIASSEKIRRELGWKPKYDSIEEIVDSAWQWRRRHPHGYED